MRHDELTDLWESLSSKVASEQGSRTRRLPVRPADVFAGVEFPSQHHFVAVLGTTGQGSFSLSPAVEVRPGLLGDRPALLIVLQDVTALDLFAHVVEDLLVGLAGCAPTEAVGVVLGRLLQWQEMLRSVPAEGLSPEKQRGLYGELYLLRHELLPHFGPRAVEGWVGPCAANQDFQLPRVAVEVKTSAGLQPPSLHIANERQLDDTGWEALYLYHLSLSAQEGGTGETLPGMVAALYTALHGDPRRRFYSLLLQYGYLEDHADRYNSTHYTLREATLMRVQEGFPRILEKDLKEGVGKVSYQIQWSECVKHTVDLSELHSLLV